MTESIETTEAEALPISLYDRTGDIKDLNTLLIPRAEYDRLRAALQVIADADAHPSDFVVWVKSRAAHALAPLPQPPKGQP
jgi:hypothetical protein